MEADFNHKDIIETELIESLPQSLKVKGKLLLQCLKLNNVNWNSAGELIIGDTKYDGTNVMFWPILVVNSNRSIYSSYLVEL